MFATLQISVVIESTLGREPCLVLSKGETDPELYHEDHKGQSKENLFQHFLGPMDISSRVWRPDAVKLGYPYTICHIIETIN